MKSELEKAISAIGFRDSKKNDKYVFDIIAHRRIGNGYESVDLAMKERGVDTLKNCASYAKENEFETLHIVLWKNKSAKEKITEFDIPLNESQQLSGTEAPAVKLPSQNEADRFFQSFGGLGGFMQETRNQIGNQLDLQYARRDLGKAEAQVVSLESKNEQLAAKNDELREQIKTLKDRVHDLERDMGYQKQSYDQRANILQLVTNGVVGFVGSQMGYTPEKLSGLLGLTPDNSDTSNQKTQIENSTATQSTVDGNEPKDERQKYIDAIVDYIYTLDFQKIQLFAGVAQYCAASDRHLAKTYEYLRNQLKQEQNGSTEDTNNSD